MEKFQGHFREGGWAAKGEGTGRRKQPRHRLQSRRSRTLLSPLSLASWECGPPRPLRISRRRTTTTASHTMPAVAPAGGRGPRARVSARQPLGPSLRLHLTPGQAGEQAHVQATWTPGNLQNPQTKQPPPRGTSSYSPTSFFIKESRKGPKSAQQKATRHSTGSGRRAQGQGTEPTASLRGHCPGHLPSEVLLQHRQSYRSHSSLRPQKLSAHGSGKAAQQREVAGGRAHKLSSRFSKELCLLNTVKGASPVGEAAWERRHRTQCHFRHFLSSPAGRRGSCMHTGRNATSGRRADTWRLWAKEGGQTELAVPGTLHPRPGFPEQVITESERP